MSLKCLSQSGTALYTSVPTGSESGGVGLLYPPHTSRWRRPCQGSAVSSPASGVWGTALTAQRSATMFSTQGGLFWHYNLVNCGLSRCYWVQIPVPCPCVLPDQTVTRHSWHPQMSGTSKYCLRVTFHSQFDQCRTRWTTIRCVCGESLHSAMTAKCS